jgi:hypothetical protein
MYGAGMKATTEEHKQQIAELLQQGLSCQLVAERLGIKRNRVLYWRNRLGIIMPDKKTRKKFTWGSAVERARAVELYETGAPATYIAIQMGRSTDWVTACLKQAGRVIRGQTPAEVGDLLYCSSCKQRLPLEKFSESPTQSCRRKRHYVCRDCATQHNKNRRFGVSKEWFVAQLAIQNQRCAICGVGHDVYYQQANRTFAIDHSHDQGGRIRGLLCDPCNRSLQHGHDNVADLERVIAYLYRPALAAVVPNATPPKGMCKCLADRHRYRAYGISPERYLELHNMHGGLCHCCGRPGRPDRQNPSGLMIEHDHVRQVIRGLVCRKCNILIGALKDSAELAASAISYIQDPPANRNPIPTGALNV